MLVKTLLIALVSFIGFLECGVGNSMIQRPIVMGPLVGLVLGDVNAGLAVGATLELAFMGNVTIGAALPPEITAGGILGTALAIVSGNGTEAALALALPIATVALLIKNTYYLTARSWFLHKSDKYAAEGNAAGVDAMHMISFLSYDIVMSLVIAICFTAAATLCRASWLSSPHSSSAVFLWLPASCLLWALPCWARSLSAPRWLRISCWASCWLHTSMFPCWASHCWA